MARAFNRPGGRSVHSRSVRVHQPRARRHGRAGSHRWRHPTAAHRHKYSSVRSGKFFRLLWPAGFPIFVVPELADQLALVLEEFAQTSGSTTEAPLRVVLRPGTMGLHRTGRAVDIYAIGGKGIGKWAQEWNAAMARVAATKDPQVQARIADEERRRNLGYKLYKALQAHGGWAQPQGYPIQLFGPWTRGEGPHKAISDRLLRMHRDHIHVAK